MNLTEHEINRYSRQIILPEIGMAGQEKIKNAKVLVIGAGGLGCPVLQYLAATGIGKIGIADHDRVEESNLQRQVLFTTQDIGKNKAEAAKHRLLTLNPHIEIIDYTYRVTSANVEELFSTYDIVVDGSDNFPTRYLLNDACVLFNKPLVSGSVFKFAGQVSVFNYGDGPTYRCLYPEPPAEGTVPDCSEIGVLGVLPGICGLLQANEVIKMVTGIGEVLKGKLLCFDMLTMQFGIFEIKTNEKNKTIDRLIDYESFCEVVPEITANELKRKIERKEKYQLIDVREPAEFAVKNIGGTLIPLAILNEHLGLIEKHQPIIVHCGSGNRSKKAVRILLEQGFSEVYNLKNGLQDF